MKTETSFNTYTALEKCDDLLFSLFIARNEIEFLSFYQYDKNYHTKDNTVLELKKILPLEIYKYIFQYDDKYIFHYVFPCAPLDEKQIIFESLITKLPIIACNVYGANIIKQLLEHTPNNQFHRIYECLKPHILSISLNQYGVVSLIQMYKKLSYDKKMDLMKILINNIKKCAIDEYAHKILIEGINNMKPYELSELCKTFNYSHILKISLSPFGSHVILALLKHGDTFLVNRLISEISVHTVPLSKDVFGNYIIQHILEKRDYKNNAIKLIRFKLMDNFWLLSISKIGSHVIEKYLNCGNSADIQKAIDFIINTTNRKLIKLITNQFGGYVMRTLIDISNKNQLFQIKDRVNKVMTRAAVRKCSVVDYMDKSITKYQSNLNISSNFRDNIALRSL